MIIKGDTTVAFKLAIMDRCTASNETQRFFHNEVIYKIPAIVGYSVNHEESMI